MDSNNIPKHIAIIMDGNRRWAKKRGLPSVIGHKEGLKTLIKVSDLVREKGVKILTVYAFSTENWNRTEEEIQGLFNLIRTTFKRELDKLIQKRIKVVFLGDTTSFPEDIKKIINSTIERSKDNENGILAIALNYGGKAEVVHAVNEALIEGKKTITEEDISEQLYTKGLPDPELIIRTGGAMRLSNFLMWQSSYSELYFTDTFWPDFNEAEIEKSLKFYDNCKRNFGR